MPEFRPDPELDKLLGIKREASDAPAKPKKIYKNLPANFVPDPELDEILGIKREVDSEGLLEKVKRIGASIKQPYEQAPAREFDIPGLEAGKEALSPENIRGAGKSVKKTLGLEEPSKNKAMQWVKNLNRGLVDVPFELAASAAQFPEDVKNIAQHPAEGLKQVAQQTGEMLSAPLRPSNYTAEKLYEDPVGAAMNLAQLAGYGGIARQGFKSLKRPPKAKLPEQVLPEELPQPLPEEGALALPRPSYKGIVPEGKTFHSYEPKAEPYAKVVEQRPARMVESEATERLKPIEPVREVVDERFAGAFPGLPYDLKPKQLRPSLEESFALPNQVRPRESTAFTTELPAEATVKQLPYPQTFSAEATAARQNPLPAVSPTESYLQSLFAESPELAQIPVPEAKVMQSPRPLKAPKKAKAPLPLKAVEKPKVKAPSNPDLASYGSLLKDALGEEGAVGNVTKITTKEAMTRKQAAREELVRKLKEDAVSFGKTIEQHLDSLGLDAETARKMTTLIRSQNTKQESQVLQDLASETPIDLIKNPATVKTAYRDPQRYFEENAPRLGVKMNEFTKKQDTSFVTELAARKQALRDKAAQLGVKIKRGTDLGKYTMRFGEGRMNLAELQKALPKEWHKAVEFDKFFRSNYNELLDDLNATREAFGKDPIAKRNDYYTHVRELTTLWDDLTSPANISNQLAGISEFTHPRQTFNPFRLRRGQGEFVEDAFEAYDRYLQPTLADKYFTPVEHTYQTIADTLAKRAQKSGKDLNNFLRFVRVHAESIHKTNPFDRALQDYVIGRKAMRVLDKAQSRFGANSVLGSASSILMQTSNIPLTFAETGAASLLKGFYSQFADTLAGRSPEMAKSDFLKRRYADTKPLLKTKTQQLRDALATPLGMFEEFVVKGSWRANFDKAMKTAKNEVEAAKMADTMTAKQVGDRSLTQRPLMFKSRAGNLLLQFQYEVNNQAQRYGYDFPQLFKTSDSGLGPKSKQAIKGTKHVAQAIIFTHIMNQIFKAINGQTPLFDPIEAGQDIWNYEGDDKLKQGVGRMGAEFLANLMPGGQTLAAAVPDKMREKYLGGPEVGLYGSGSPLVSAVQGVASQPTARKMAEELLYKFGMPAGGSQLKKTVEAYRTIDEEPNAFTPLEKAQGYIFGPYAGKEMKARTLNRKKEERKKLRKRRHK